MRVKMAGFVFVCAICMASCVAGDMIVIPRLPVSPVCVDGKFDPAEYASASMLSGFMGSRDKRQLVHREGEVYLLSTSEKLFICARLAAENGDPGGGLVTHGKPISSDDDIEFMVVSDDGSAVYHFLFNSAGAAMELSRRNGSRVEGWKSGAVHSGMVKRGGVWVHELAVDWKAMEGIDPLHFRFNAARNFAASGMGYGTLARAKTIYDAKSIIEVKAVEGFGGVRIGGVNARLWSGEYTPTCEGDPSLAVRAQVRTNDVCILEVPCGKSVRLPAVDGALRLAVDVRHPRFGNVFRRRDIIFETGLVLTGGPVSEKRQVGELCRSYVRFYPGADKAAVIFDTLGDFVSGRVEVVSPENEHFKAVLAKNEADGSWKAMVRLTRQRARKAGRWKGALIAKDASGKETRFEDAFGFDEIKFPWVGNKLGVSDEILSPFTPITVEDGGHLGTLLRDHSLSGEGLVTQVTAKGAEILSVPMHFELTSGGKALRAKDASFAVVERAPHRVKTSSSAMFGDWKYTAETTWEYDGLAVVKCRFTPPAKGTPVEKLTLSTGLKASETTLYHALVDMGAGNPAGLIPDGTGEVWNSSGLPRKKMPTGVNVTPGEFTPYAWVGGEERGMAYVFDSPVGYDLEDGTPMIRFLRSPDTVTVECDIVSRAHAQNGPIEFSFAFMATPVKPMHARHRKDNFSRGNKLPGLRQVELIVGALTVGLFPEPFMQVPYSNDYSFAMNFMKSIKKRQCDPAALQRHHDVLVAAYDNYLKTHVGVGGVPVKVMVTDCELQQLAMTADKIIPYTCCGLLPLENECYRHYKAEWATIQIYHGGRADRLFLTPSLIDYCVWTFDKLLEAGIDGVYFDELYVMPQTNPDLSPARDYKGRVIPEMGILAGRELIKRTAHLFRARKRERLICLHETNSMIVPEFTFGTYGLCWEEKIPRNFIDQFPIDYIRAHSTGLQAGLDPVALLLPRIPDPDSMPVPEYLKRRSRIVRTALSLLMQHDMVPLQQHWGDYTDQYKWRYVQWAFGTHKDDCTFMPYWSRGKLPFSVTGNFLVSAYRRGRSALIAVSNLGSAAKTTLTVDRNALGLAPGAVLADAMTGERFAFPSATFEVPECEYRWIYAGPEEMLALLEPPEPDPGFIHK